MAIDTPEKRRNVAGIPFGPGVTPNATPDAEWRQQVGSGYSGIAAGEGGDAVQGVISIDDRAQYTVTLREAPDGVNYAMPTGRFARHYSVGQGVTFTAEFRDENSNAAYDPDQLEFWYRHEDDASATTLEYGTDAEVEKDSTGHYHVWLKLETAGTWYYGWDTEGESDPADEFSFVVDATQRVGA